MSPIASFSLIIRLATSMALWAVLGLAGGPIGAVVGAVIGVALGSVHGLVTARHAVYPETARGVWLLVVDNTWSILNTTIGSIYLAINMAFGNRVDPPMSRGRSSVVLRKGIFPGFATTLGPVEAGTSPHIARHEYVHVLQARIFGPLYVPLVVLNYIVATILPYWLLYHDRAGHPIRSVSDYFMKGVYPHVWNEEWAYRVEGTAP